VESARIDGGKKKGKGEKVERKKKKKGGGGRIKEPKRVETLSYNIPPLPGPLAPKKRRGKKEKRGGGGMGDTAFAFQSPPSDD